MNPRLEEDLERWETGTLSLAKIEERHPDQDVGGLIELHHGLTTLALEATPDPQRSWDRLGPRLPERALDPVLISMSRRDRRRGLTRRRVAVLALAAVLILTGGLAGAGVLPAPVQDAIANVAGHLGLHLPAPADLPGQTSHGKGVSHAARSTSAEGCKKGQAVSAVASSSGQAHRRSTVDQPSRCQKPEAAGGPSARGNSGSGTAGGSRKGPAQVRGSGGHRHEPKGPRRTHPGP